MQTSVWFIRHGQVENPKEIIYGRLPGFGLSLEGSQQVKKTADFLKGKAIAAIYSSPQQRCQETASIISQFFPKVEIKTSQMLAEGEIGWQGKTQKEIEDSGLNAIYLKNPSQLKGGKETFFDIAERAKKIALELVNHYPGKEIICVSHKDVIRCLRLILQDKPIDLLNTFDCALASVTKFDFNGGRIKKISYLDLSKNDQFQIL